VQVYATGVHRVVACFGYHPTQMGASSACGFPLDHSPPEIVLRLPSRPPRPTSGSSVSIFKFSSAATAARPKARQSSACGNAGGVGRERAGGVSDDMVKPCFITISCLPKPHPLGSPPVWRPLRWIRNFSELNVPSGHLVPRGALTGRPAATCRSRCGAIQGDMLLSRGSSASAIGQPVREGVGDTIQEAGVRANPSSTSKPLGCRVANAVGQIPFVLLTKGALPEPGVFRWGIDLIVVLCAQNRADIPSPRRDVYDVRVRAEPACCGKRQT
jgi:hypothetical protein